ncbi:unnamed protein product [Darwinula stevensoni]|uniref:Uncharacterized protein n=1 Tax=Darwinula stevensoni TaxID=69355 RepID=A0A7R9AFN8_9CRUS|nr:unnamed protein product [Darwinula stevensoni]CAG0902833.1 unnamed protein product [Darwinula stevensoni]
MERIATSRVWPVASAVILQEEGLIHIELAVVDGPLEIVFEDVTVEDDVEIKRTFRSSHPKKTPPSSPDCSCLQQGFRGRRDQEDLQEQSSQEDPPSSPDCSFLQQVCVHVLSREDVEIKRTFRSSHPKRTPHLRRTPPVSSKFTLSLSSTLFLMFPQFPLTSHNPPSFWGLN